MKVVQNAQICETERLISDLQSEVKAYKHRLHEMSAAATDLQMDESEGLGSEQDLLIADNSAGHHGEHCLWMLNTSVTWRLL